MENFNKIGGRGVRGPGSEPSEAASDKKRKKTFWIIVSVFVALFVLIAGLISLRAFSDRCAHNAYMEYFYNTFRGDRKVSYQTQNIDSYGGKTPKETLSLFTDAIQEKNYELASKYFVTEKQEEELERFSSFNSNTADQYVSYLDTLKLEDKTEKFRDLYKYYLEKYDVPESEEEFIERMKEIYKGHERMISTGNVHGLIIDFVLYPNGVWKILER